MTEHQIVSAIENYVTSHEGVTDFPVSPKQIADEVDTLRMRLVSELDNARMLVSPFVNYTQVIEDLPTHKTDGNDRYVDIPAVYHTIRNTPAFVYAGAANGNTPYRVLTGNHGIYASQDRWIGNVPQAILQGTRLTFKQSTLKKVRIVAVFRDPSDLDVFGYDSSKDTYPIPDSLVDQIIGKTANSYMQTMYRIRPQSNQQVDLPMAGGGGSQ